MKNDNKDETFRGSRGQQSEGNTFSNIRLQNELNPTDMRISDKGKKESEEGVRIQPIPIDNLEEVDDKRQSQCGDRKTEDRSSGHDIFNLNLFRELEAEIQQAELNVQSPAPIQYDMFLFKAPSAEPE